MATTNSDDDNEDSAMISRLQKEDDDEEVDLDVDDDGDDEIDSAVEASDNAMVDNVVRDLKQDLFGEEMLTREDINFRHFSLIKVCSSRTLTFNFVFLTMSITSHQSWKEDFQQPNTLH